MLKVCKIKRIAAFILLFTMLALMVCLATIPLSAQKTRGLIVVGDAISSGRGLDDRAGKSYGGKLAAKIGVNSGGYDNIAVDVMSSFDLIDLLPLYQAEIEDADLMVISTGTDDIYPFFIEAFARAAGDDSITYSKLSEYAKDDNFITRLKGEIDHTALINATVRYSVNLVDIISIVREFNPNIRIIFLTLYNPLDGFASLKKVVGSNIDLMNDSLSIVAEKNKCAVIDLAGAFAGKTTQLTDITSLDVSPNAAGHMLIAELLEAYIETLPTYTEETTETTKITETESGAEDTNNITETTPGEQLGVIIAEQKSKVWLYIVVAVCAGGTGIVIGAFSVKNNK